MMSAWVLPDDVADALPSAARHIEELRRQFLDAANRFGYELVIPPLIEYLDALCSGAGAELDVLTFKLVDQMNGRTLGVRADTTAQVARIDAHLLNRKGVTRLCYVGPVLHTRSERPYATREPLQFGAEIYGHSGLEADVEVVELAVACLAQAGVKGLRLDVADLRIVNALLLLGSKRLRADTMEHGVSVREEAQLHRLLAAKDQPGLEALLERWTASGALDVAVAAVLEQLPTWYGGIETLDYAQSACAAVQHSLAAKPSAVPEAVAQKVTEMLEQAFGDMRQLHDALSRYYPTLALGFDLSDLQGYDYYTGMRFALYATGAADSLARGGRYDEVGAAFGRRRPAVGFSLDIKEVIQVLEAAPLKPAIRAPWLIDAELRQAVEALRAQGETVVCQPLTYFMQGHADEVEEFFCDRVLVQEEGCWVVKPL